MKNHLQSGNHVEVIAPYTLASGGGCQVGTMFGVAVAAAASGAQVILDVRGVFELPKLGTDVVTQGQSLYWDNASSPRRLTTTAGTNLYVGKAVEAAAGGGVVLVKALIDGMISKVVG